MIFFSRKPKPITTLPPDWPSPYHNKCSQPDCIYPNSPQTTKGVYPCRGVPGGFYCEGTFKVSSSRAHDTERYLKELGAARRTQAAEEQRHRTPSDMRRPTSRAGAGAVGPGPGLVQDPNVRRRAREDYTPHYAVADERRHYAMYGAPTRGTPHARPHRPSDASRSPPQLPRRPSYGGYRPSSSQVEAEYITDQIMMHLYPERKIQPRWI